MSFEVERAVVLVLRIFGALFFVAGATSFVLAWLYARGR